MTNTKITYEERRGFLEVESSSRTDHLKDYYYSFLPVNCSTCLSCSWILELSSFHEESFSRSASTLALSSLVSPFIQRTDTFIQFCTYRLTVCFAWLCISNAHGIFISTFLFHFEKQQYSVSAVLLLEYIHLNQKFVKETPLVEKVNNCQGYEMYHLKI